MSARSRYRASRVVAKSLGWADTMDEAFSHEDEGRPVARPGWIARTWAAAKMGVVGILAPAWAPTIMIRARSNHQRARFLSSRFPQQVLAISHGGSPRPPANLVVDVDAEQRIVIFSDLHRCISGRLDWPRRQHTKSLYTDILDHYADDTWTLCENGDIEDYWMVGGSTYGATYDALRMAGGAIARYGRTDLLVETYRAHLDHIVENNAEIYSTIRSRFAEHGRYVRTVGNHDSPNSRPMVVDRLRVHLGNFPIADYIALRNATSEMVGLITHGHHTDGWNAPTRDNLGKLSSWISNTLVDVPKVTSPEGLPPIEASQLLLSGRMPDRLITVSPVFGANSSYDSLDEELLFDAIRDAGLEDLWFLLGHTHSPVMAPLSRNGSRWHRYLNSGSGVTDGVITAIEWDGTGEVPTAQLVAWSRWNEDSDPESVVVTRRGTRLVRTVFTPHGDYLETTSEAQRTRTTA